MEWGTVRYNSNLRMRASAHSCNKISRENVYDFNARRIRNEIHKRVKDLEHENKLLSYILAKSHREVKTLRRLLAGD